jgi:hypothetical protein
LLAQLAAHLEPEPEGPSPLVQHILEPPVTIPFPACETPPPAGPEPTALPETASPDPAAGSGKLAGESALDALLATEPPDPEAGRWELMDGEWVDRDTGEVFEMAPIAGRAGKFAVVDQESADWVISRIAKRQGDLAGIAARREGLLRQLQREEDQAENGIRSLVYLYGRQIAAFAVAELDGQKRRSVDLDHGRLMDRETRGSHKIRDMGRAVELASWLRPEAVKPGKPAVPSVGVKDLLAIQAQQERLFRETQAEDALWVLNTLKAILATEKPRRTVSLDTGVGGFEPVELAECPARRKAAESGDNAAEPRGMAVLLQAAIDHVKGG